VFRFVLTCVIVFGMFGLNGSVMAAGLSDPMRPPADYRSRSSVPLKTQEVAAGSFELQSILVGASRALAVVDGTSLSSGDWYRGVRLIEINADAVTFQRRSGEKFVLNLTTGVHKQVAAEREKRQK